MHRHSISHVALVVALASSAGFARAEQIGTTTAVIPDAKSRPMGGGERLLTMGTSMTGNERVTTGAAGRTQILFIDGSAINVGPSSSLVLDEYVYDPRSGSGKLAVTLGKGAMRFVGGKISKSETVTIATPVATVGIRGGVAQIEYSPEQGLTARFLYGEFLSVSVGGMISTTNRAGTAIDLRPGSPPSAPRPIPQSELAQSTAQTTGGAPRSPAPGPAAGPAAGPAPGPAPGPSPGPAPGPAPSPAPSPAMDIGLGPSPAPAGGVGGAPGGLQGGIASGPPKTGGLPAMPVTQPPPPRLQPAPSGFQPEPQPFPR